MEEGASSFIGLEDWDVFNNSATCLANTSILYGLLTFFILSVSSIISVPLIKIIGKSGFILINSSTKAMPYISGIRLSVTTKPNFPALNFSKASLPFTASSTSYPFISRTALARSRFTSSSSTTRIRTPTGLEVGIFLFDLENIICSNTS